MPDSRSTAFPARPQRILVVDDDPLIVQLMAARLQQEGYEVSTAFSAEEALDGIARHGLPHLAVVDLKMPGLSGFDFCRSVQQWADLPVILLSSVDDEDTTVQGLLHYAEDYVTKPCSPRELAARVQRVLRRVGDFGYALDPAIRVDDGLEIQFAQQQALVAGRPTPLTPTETKLLYILMRNAGRTVTTDFLLRRLWPLEEVFADTLRVHIHRLRHKVEPDPERPRYILTERGLGYKFPASNEAAS